MQSVFQWFKDQKIDPAQPWAIFGKGPTFEKRRQYDLSSFKTISLNHAVREQPVDLAHVIDLDVLQHCGTYIESNAAALVIPWVPHVNNWAGTVSLDVLSRSEPLLRRLNEQGRLLWYNLSSTSVVNGDSPVVPVKWFSAEAVLNILAMAGVRTVRSLGIDGGTTYSNAFHDLRDKTLLANGQQNFNAQFAEIAKTILRTGIDYAPLDVESPIRVFVGSTAEQMLSVKVLEHSIRTHSSMSVEVVPLHLAGIPVPSPRDPKNAPRTPFSFHRFLIPALTRYRGRAIYLDSDMQLFKDIRLLWTMPFDGAEILAVTQLGNERRPQFSVMLLDCDALRRDISEIVGALDKGELTYERLMYDMEVTRKIRGDLSPAWNSLESYESSQTALLHYTDMPTQPWVSRDNPLGHLWMQELFEALTDGFITREYIREHVDRGWVRPSLLYQVEHRIADSLLLPRQARALDKSFVAPYRRMRGAVSIDPMTKQRLSLPLIKANRRLRATFARLTQRPHS